MSGGRVTDTGVHTLTVDRESIGVRLRVAREQRGLTSETVGKQLRLDETIINALENDDRQHLPAPIFVQGYLRSYARLLGLPEDELVADYTRQSGELPPLSVAGVSERRQLLGLPSARMVRNIILVILAVIVLWLAFPYMNRLTDTQEAPSGDAREPGRLVIPPAEH